MTSTGFISGEPRGKPLQVYLDSADYSDMSNPRAIKNRPALENVRDFLLDSVVKGIIEIRFSAVTVAEILHAQDIYKDVAMQRAKLLTSYVRVNALDRCPLL